MNSALQRYTCPSCEADFDAPSKYCRQCGSSMDDSFATDDTLHTGEQEVAKLASGVSAAGLDEKTDAGSSRDAGNDRDEAERSSRRRSSDKQRDAWLGRTIDNRYRVIEVIGRGGMGMVYKVEHQRMGKIAAMKVLHHEYDNDPEVLERFQLEAEAVSRLAHPNTVQVFDFGQSRGSLFLIMEYIRGQNLSVLLHRDGPIDFKRAGPMFMQICAALSEAHSLGVVHRDLKPENVLATRTQRGRDFVKVLDFGLAKLTEREEASSVTDKGLIVGTPYYMSPEQIRGDDVDARTDIYSLGSLMYRVLTGKHAFTAKTPMGVLTKHLTTELLPPSRRAPEIGLSPALDAIVVKAMAKDREERYDSIIDMLDAIERAYVDASGHSSSLGLPGMSSLPVDADSPSELVRNLALDDSDEIDYGILSSVRLQRADLDDFERSLTRRRWIGAAIVPLCLIAVAAVVVYFLAFRSEGPRTAEAEPNNVIDAATLIAPDTTVTGYLGKRLDKRRSDHDFYRVRTDTASTIVSVHVTALPNIDIEVSLLDPTGATLAHIDEGRMGQDEWLRRYRIRGRFYVLVTEARAGNLSGMPTENISDPYEMTVSFHPESTAEEIEPNDSPSDAHGLRPGKPVTGHLDRRSDVDCYRFAGESGRYQLAIEGAAAVPITWHTDRHPDSSERNAIIELADGETLRLARGDAQAAATEPLVGVSAPYTVRLTPVAAP